MKRPLSVARRMQTEYAMAKKLFFLFFILYIILVLKGV